MLKKNQLVLFSAVSLSVAAMGNSYAEVGGITGQEYKDMHASGEKCGLVCQRKKAIEEAERKHKEEAAARPALTRRTRAPAVSRAEEQKIRQIEKDIVEARDLVKELDKGGGSAALDKMTADLEKKNIPSSQTDSILGALGEKAAEEKLPEVNLSHPPLKVETTEEEHITTTLPPPPGMPKAHVPPPPSMAGMKKPSAGDQKASSGVQKPPALSGHDALMAAIRKRRSPDDN